MSIESRLRRGDNPDDVRALFPNDQAEVDRVLKEMSKKKPGRPKKTETKDETTG